MEAQHKEILLSKVKAKIEEMRLRAATEPSFGKKVGRYKGLFRSLKEKQEFKAWKEMLEKKALEEAGRAGQEDCMQGL